MINIYETKKHDEQIISLWQEAFGDTREDILFFLTNCNNYSCLRLDDDGILSSMLFLVDCLVNNEKCKYIYAACTSNTKRKSGYMTKLLEYAKCKYDRVILIPADEKLAEYYKKRSFINCVDIRNIYFSENKEIKEYLFEGCELKNPYALEFRR